MTKLVSNPITDIKLLESILEIVLKANKHRHKLIELLKEIEKKKIMIQAEYIVKYKERQIKKGFIIKPRLIQNIWIDFLVRNNELVSIYHYRIKVRATYSILECLGCPLCHINKKTNIDTLIKFLFDKQTTSILMRLPSSFYFNDMKATYFLDKYTRTKNGFEKFKGLC